MSRADEPAYPTTFENHGDMNVSAPNGEVVPPQYSLHLHGLTIRERFAAMAMWSSRNPHIGFDHEAAAHWACIGADALIAALAKPAAPAANPFADMERYLVERSEWLEREARSGGDAKYLRLKREETDYILGNLREIAARVTP